MNTEVELYLKKCNLAPVVYEHPAVFSVDEAEIHCKHVKGMHCKNLFLKEKECVVPRYFLVVMDAFKRLNINQLAKLLGVKKLTFGSPDELFSYLGLTPGSVSPLGLINNTNHEVVVIVDHDVWDAASVNFHPNINTASLEFTREQFHLLMESFANEKKVVKLE